MNVNTEKTVRELAAEIPGATRVFESLGIDYCCGGSKTLSEACNAAKLAVDTVVANLASAESSRLGQPTEKNWNSESLADLVAHIVNKHHSYVRQELPRLGQLAEKVARKHGSNHPETVEVQEVFAGLSHELTMHLMKEEQVLFPYVERMEEAALEKRPVAPPPFGTVQHPIRMMVMEHDGAGDALRELRQATNDYAIPPDACMSFQALYLGLREFEADLHQHIHLENNILFPRAVAMEAGR